VTDTDTEFRVPTDPNELELMLGDSQKMARLFEPQNKGLFAEFIGNYANKVLQQNQDIATQVRDETQRVIGQFLRDNPPAAEGAAWSPIDMSTVAPSAAYSKETSDYLKRQGLFNKKAMGAAIDSEFTGGGAADYFATIWHNANRDAKLQAKLSRMRNAFSSTVPSEGGFLIPESLRSELLRVALEDAIVRPRARVIPMETLRVPFPAVDETSRVSSVHGGIVAYWTPEGAALTDSSAQFSQIVLDAKKLTTYTEVPNELLSDTIGSFEAFINMMFPEAITFYEDDAYINGNGVGMPLGFRKGPAVISVTKEVGQDADSIVWENIIKMYSRMLPGSLGRAVWIASIDTFPQLATMALNVGTGGSAIWLNNGAQGPPMTILGRPVIFTEKLPTVGDAGDIMFVDLNYYLIGDRQVMSALSSPHYRFGQDKTAFRIIQRVDGTPWLRSAITPKNNGATLSPFVQIEGRA
jgi:HK97 family phage major capsid protein